MVPGLNQNFVSTLSGELMDRILQNSVYAFMLTISGLRLSPVNFCLFLTEL